MLRAGDAARLHAVEDPTCGLRAVIAIDDLTLGPAAGGVRTAPYPSWQAAEADALRLAHAMTEKCALAGLPAGGGKAVVMDHPGLDRPRAFAVLGEHVETLAGQFRTAGDYGTHDADLAVMAAHTRFVHRGAGLVGAVGRSTLRCLEALAARRGVPVAGLRVAIQGCGAIGGAVARALGDAGCKLLVADTSPARAAAVATATRADVIAPEHVLAAEVDILAPCALGGVIDVATAKRVRAWAICGAANGVLAGDDAGEALRARGILFVPDAIASAGAVIDGLGRSLLHLGDPNGLIDALGPLCTRLLDEAAARGVTPVTVARELAARRLAEARAKRDTIGG
jgi:leucine dehydrogenase